MTSEDAILPWKRDARLGSTAADIIVKLIPLLSLNPLKGLHKIKNHNADTITRPQAISQLFIIRSIIVLIPLLLTAGYLNAFIIPHFLF